MLFPTHPVVAPVLDRATGLSTWWVLVGATLPDALFLGWPLVVLPDSLALGLWAFVRQYVGTPSLFPEVLLWAAAAAVVYRRRALAGPPTRAYL